MKCANENCNHRTIKKEYVLCSMCRKVEQHKCAREGCDNLCISTYCRHHGHKLIQCSNVNRSGIQCTKMTRNGLCSHHSEKIINWKKQWKLDHLDKPYYQYDPIKAKITNREKRIRVLEQQITELKNYNTHVDN